MSARVALSLVCVGVVACGLAGVSLRGAPAAVPSGSSSASTAPPPAHLRAVVDSGESDEMARLDAAAHAPAVDVRIAPSSRGVLGAWLVAGPFRAAKVDPLGSAVAGVDEAALGAAAGSALRAPRDLRGSKATPPARWTIASSGEGPIDLKAALDAGAPDVIGYAAGILHIERPGRHLLLLGVDDGVRVSVDGRAVFTRDESRPVRDDDDVIALDLAAGDHDITLKLHQRGGAWALRVRVVDAALAPPLGAYLRLAGTSAEDARALATKMSWVSLDRAFDAASTPPTYRPRLTVRFPEGAPRGLTLGVSTRLLPSAGEPLFDVEAGEVPITAGGVGEQMVDLPPVAPSAAALTLETTVAGRVVRVPFAARPESEQALVHAERVLAKTPADAPWLSSGSLDSVKFLTTRLAGLVAHGDADAEAQQDEAREVDRLATALERTVDPYEGRTGPMRRAIRSTIDGQPSEFGLYVPPWYKPGTTRRYPLVVGLHGMNGYALGMMRWIFGGDDPGRDQAWEARHVGTLPPADAFVITPAAHGNAFYRELGETDVMQIVAWAMKTFPIDPSRVTITGPSMGGIGAAWLPLHHPHVFAGAAPLCGYHSYLIRGDVAGRPMRPWERFLAEERSNSLWADNGEHLPLWIVHGTQDLPEENSGVLIKRYEQLHFSVKHEHPTAGHNVWQQTYEELKGITWLANRRVDLHPRHVRFKTTRTRWATSAWITVDELATEAGWGNVDARVPDKTHIRATTSGVASLTFARDEKLLDPASAVDVAVDGQAALSFAAGEPMTIHREASEWKKGQAPHETSFKHGTVTGPIRDVFHEPILFVYGAGDVDARANEQVAQAFAHIRFGVHVTYPIMSDAEFFAKGETLANDRALFLVGRTNRVLTALEKISPLPVHVDADAVTVGRERFTGRELGAAFIRPNPARADRYVVVVAGTDVPGTLRALSLPELLPDFVVWDERLAPSRGQLLLGAGSVRAGGFFTKEWALPAQIEDPFAKAP